MIIKSRFKDYYDYVAHIYGGGDPSIVYVREPFTPMVDGYRNSVDVPYDNKTIFDYDHYLIGKFGDKRFKWLSVNGCQYLIVSGRQNFGWQVITEENHPEIWKFLSKPSPWFAKQKKKATDYFGVFRNSNLDISKAVKAPVFTFNFCDGLVVVDSEIPTLQDIGFDKIIKPEQLYQDISYFIVNVMKESPDMMPPTKMTDKEKIQQHGFDLKQSFRHRK